MLVLATGVALAAAGALDPTFGGDGKVTTSVGPASDVAEAVAIAPDGKIVVAGTASGTPSSWAVARYRANGQLDTGFSGDGRRTGPLGDAFDVAVQSNGRILVVGAFGTDMGVARYLPGGPLDPSFSGDGKRTINVGSASSGNGVALDSNGRIVIAGYGVSAMDERFAVVRLRPDGSLDTSFSGDGKTMTNFENGPLDNRANDLAIQANGRIVAAGLSDETSSDRSFALARYLTGGQLDSSFAGDGRKLTQLGNRNDTINGVDLEGGRIVVAGFKETADLVFDFAVARYRSDGSLDQGFSANGVRTAGFGPGAENDFGNDVAVQSNSRVVAAGRADIGGDDDDFGVMRFLPNGSLDTSFSNDGKRPVDFGEDDAASGVALAGGKIVAAGEKISGLDTRFAVARLLSG